MKAFVLLMLLTGIAQAEDVFIPRPIPVKYYTHPVAEGQGDVIDVARCKLDAATMEEKHDCYKILPERVREQLWRVDNGDIQKPIVIHLYRY